MSATIPAAALAATQAATLADTQATRTAATQADTQNAAQSETHSKLIDHYSQICALGTISKQQAESLLKQVPPLCFIVYPKGKPFKVGEGSEEKIYREYRALFRNPQGGPRQIDLYGLEGFGFCADLTFRCGCFATVRALLQDLIFETRKRMYGVCLRPYPVIPPGESSLYPWIYNPISEKAPDSPADLKKIATVALYQDYLVDGGVAHTESAVRQVTASAPAAPSASKPDFKLRRP